MPKRKFLDYIKTNPLIVAIWVASLFIGIVSLIDNVFVITGFMGLTFLVTLIGGLIDWRRNG